MAKHLPKCTCDWIDTARTFDDVKRSYQKLEQKKEDDIIWGAHCYEGETARLYKRYKEVRRNAETSSPFTWKRIDIGILKAEITMGMN